VARPASDAGFADPTAIGCAARSYGGYLTVAAMARYPALFQVGVDVRGIVKFETFFAHTEPWIAAAAVSRYGDPQQDAAQVRPELDGRTVPAAHHHPDIVPKARSTATQAQSARPLANSRPGRGGHW
jgi:dipeptidyl aminopeptidase/acylaminoacyl peptidase